MENHLVTAVVILDLSAAFDTVDHDLLLDVPEKWFGITDVPRKWYHNYLKQRYQNEMKLPPNGKKLLPTFK